MKQSDIEDLTRFAAYSQAVFLPHTPSKDFVLRDLLSHTSQRLGIGSQAIGNNVVDAKWFRTHIMFDHHNTMLSHLYSASSFKTIVAMRGHGLYLCIALNIPCVALSTQDKVSGFAKICKLDDFLVDIKTHTNWYATLKAKVDLLQSDDSFRMKWYEKRDFCIRHWNVVAKRFHADLRMRFQKKRKIFV